MQIVPEKDLDANSFLIGNEARSLRDYLADGHLNKSFGNELRLIMRCLPIIVFFLFG
jgi:hypothetical protein